MVSVDLTVSFVAVAALVSGFSCGADGNGARAGAKPSEVAAVPQDSGPFGGVMVNTTGEMLFPLVARDAGGNAIAVTGAMWVDARRGSLAVYLDADRLPTKVVLGDFVFLYANWDAAAGTVDIAEISTVTGYVAISRAVSVARLATAPALPAPLRTAGTLSAISTALSSSKLAEPTCFPACESDAKNWSELFKIAGLAVEIGGCIGLTAATSGAAALAFAIPCAGAIVTTATLVTGNESWIDDHESLYWGLKASGCGMEAAGCVASAFEMASKGLDAYDRTASEHAALVSEAETALFAPARPTGVIEQGGGLPACPGPYECTPGHYVSCYPDGAKPCGADCRWGTCSAVPGGGEPTRPYTITCVSMSSESTCCSGDRCDVVPATSVSMPSAIASYPVSLSAAQLQSSICPELTSTLASTGCVNVTCSVQASTGGSFAIQSSCQIRATSICTASTIGETCTVVAE